jgi:hypothetical protein
MGSIAEEVNDDLENYLRHHGSECDLGLPFAGIGSS